MGLYVIFTINVVVAFTCYVARNNTPLYLLCNGLTYLVIAGIFGSCPTAIPKTFGPRYGAQVYALIMFACAFTSLLNFLVVKYLEQQMGYQNIFYAGGGCAVVSFLLNAVLTEKIDVER